MKTITDTGYGWMSFITGVLTFRYMFMLLSGEGLSSRWFPALSLLTGATWFIYGVYTFLLGVTLAGEKDDLFPWWLLLEGFQGTLIEGKKVFSKGMLGVTFIFLSIVFILSYIGLIWPGKVFLVLGVFGSIVSGLVWAAVLIPNALAFYSWWVLHKDTPLDR